MEVKTVRLITGQTRLKANMHRMKIAESPLCACALAPQTIEHVFSDCPCLSDCIDKLHNGLDYIYSELDTPPYERNTQLLNFLWPKHKDDVTRDKINKLTLEFISKLNADEFAI